MDGLRFDLDFRITELKKSMSESVGNQSIELGFLEADLRKHMGRETIPMNFKIKMAVMIDMIDRLQDLHFYLIEYAFSHTDGFSDREDYEKYVSYHVLLTELLSRLIELDGLVHSHFE